MTEDHDEEKLEALSQQFVGAVELHAAGKTDAAEDELRAVLRVEPRLAEPHLLLGRILLDTDRLEDAEEHTREALKILLSGQQWTEDVPAHVVLAVCHAQLAEILRRTADEDDVIFGDPERFHAIVEESRTHFQKASDLDPTDETSSYYAFFMGPVEN
ncbi:MAG: tetratricopeptide repeat protein [Alphaproteobacteria bacterium]|nr:tetratricopeptide repeat protein [Alphaproteobacteria bacterium]